jgi:hypothetical protein
MACRRSCERLFKCRLARPQDGKLSFVGDQVVNPVAE